MKIDTNIPIPERRDSLSGDQTLLRKTIAKMKVGHSFVWHENKHPYACAAQVGCRVKTRKINGDGYRIWKISPSDVPTNHND